MLEDFQAFLELQPEVHHTKINRNVKLSGIYKGFTENRLWIYLKSNKRAGIMVKEQWLHDTTYQDYFNEILEDERKESK